MRINHNYILILLILLAFLVIPLKFNDYEFPTFRVVLDPGHGGRCRFPRSKHGDRYDSISKTFLDNYRDGAAYRKISEHRVMYSIARKTEKILKLCSPDGDYKKFVKLLKKYTNKRPSRIVIITNMSRGRALSGKEAKKSDDPNAEFRLFDYPDKNSKIQPGRLSKINRLKPHLVVSLHLASSAPAEYRAMNPVVAAPYSFLHKGLLYLQGNIKSRKFFYNSRLDEWFNETTKRTHFQWFLNDTSLYFTGYPLDKKYNIQPKKFKGYRYNMVSWAYRDSSGWENIAKNHYKHTKYAQHYNDFVPESESRFWEREKSKYESYRREGGEEGFGGDNAYASYEIIRFILFSLYLKNHRYTKHEPGKSFISVWVLPLYVNAVTAFIELGYLRRRKDRYTLTRKQDEIAEGIAVGIYSLFAGIEPRRKKFKYLPKGKVIDLDKYNIEGKKSYFDIAADDNDSIIAKARMLLRSLK